MEYILSGPAVLLRASLSFIFFLLAFDGLGAFLLNRCMSLSDLSRGPLRRVLGISAGLFLFSLAVFAVGEAGFLRPYTIGVLGLGGIFLYVLFSLPHEKEAARSVVSVWKKAEFPDRLLFLGVTCLALWTFVASQAPAIGNDALSYHLYWPKIFVSGARIVHDVSNARSLWPFMMEMLYAAGLSVQGTALAQLFGWLTTLLAVLIVPASVFHFYSQDKRAVRYTAVLAGFIPAVWMQSVYANVDGAMALYAFAAFVVCWIWKERGFEKKTAFLAGILMAALLSVKMYGVVSCFVLGIFCSIWSFRSKKPGASFLSLVCLILTAAAFGGFWYARSWFYLGNPFFPFFARWFGGAGFEHGAVGFAELPKDVLHFLALPWNVTLEVDRFGGEPIGCLLLMALPALLYRPSLKPVSRVMLAFLFFYVGAWFLLIQHIRFIFPALFFAAAALGPAMSGVLRDARRLKKGFGALTGVAVLLHFGLSLYYPWPMVKGALGLPNADAYVLAHERSYPFLKEIGPLLPPGSKLLFMTESRLFYSPAPALDYSPAMDLQSRREGIPFAEWARRHGVTHVLTSWTEYWPEQSMKLLKSHFGDTLTKAHSKEVQSQARTYHYDLWEIRP